MKPQAGTDQSKGIRKGGQGLGIPGGSTNGQVVTGQEGMRQEGDQGKQAQQEWRGASNSLVGPLALGFDTKMLTNMPESGFHLPATHEESQDLLRGQRQISGQQGLRV